MSQVESIELFELSHDQIESVACAAEMLADADHDTQKAGDSLASVLKSAGELTYALWESVRLRFVHSYAMRARDNGRAANPEGAADDAWLRMAKYLDAIHGFKKPKSKSKDAERMAEKREAEKLALLESVAGKSAAVLRDEQVALYKTATPEAIAQAKALDKAIKEVDKAEKGAIKLQMDALASSLTHTAKELIKRAREANDPLILENALRLLKQV